MSSEAAEKAQTTRISMEEPSGAHTMLEGQRPALSAMGRGKSNDVGNTSETIIVDWDGPDDPMNPKNWTYRRKWEATIIVSLFTLISPLSSSMVAPASLEVARDFHITSSVITEMTMSVFLLGYAVGPLLLGPLSEIYGRSRVLQLANLFFLVWNFACGFAQNAAQLITFRLLSGFSASASPTIGGGVLADMWHPEERGRAMAMYSLAPQLGPIIGPIGGAWIAQFSTWRWVYWSSTIAGAFIQVAGVFYLPETFAPLLLERKADASKPKMDKEKGYDNLIRTIVEENGPRSRKRMFALAMIRPFTLLALEPIVQLISLHITFICGLMYVFLTSIPVIFSNVYHQPTGIAGLHYIALGVGLTMASQINARVLDLCYVYFKNKNGGVGEPEFRLPVALVGALIIPVGLFMSGWAAQARVHWIVTDIGIVFVGAGIMAVFQTMRTYVVDTFTLHAASALAAVGFLFSLAGFVFPLFTPTMYLDLGYGKADSILACLSIVLGWPALWMFWKYGKRIRAMSHYARKSS